RCARSRSPAGRRRAARSRRGGRGRAAASPRRDREGYGWRSLYAASRLLREIEQRQQSLVHRLRGRESACHPWIQNNDVRSLLQPLGIFPPHEPAKIRSLVLRTEII